MNWRNAHRRDKEAPRLRNAPFPHLEGSRDTSHETTRQLRYLANLARALGREAPSVASAYAARVEIDRLKQVRATSRAPANRVAR